LVKRRTIKRTNKKVYRFKAMKRKIEISCNKNIVVRLLKQSMVSTTYVSWMNDYDVVKFTNQKNLKHTFNSVKFYVKEKLESEDELLLGFFSNNLHIGNIKIGPINFYNRNTQISYIVGNKNFWGTGIATSVISYIVNYCFESLDLHKVSALTYSNNIASQKVLIKNNFIKEAIIKKQLFFENKFVDMFYFSKFRDDEK
tara:strand:+ start:7548 stop:8144 length:597 start_codon:yes stop_codon:yes gene_type:complete